MNPNKNKDFSVSMALIKRLLRFNNLQNKSPGKRLEWQEMEENNSFRAMGNS